jgi:glutathione synthase/RimK-type ligase-like ATP-grasp enzyme
VSDLVDRLNQSCFCIGTDLDALARWLQDDLAARGLERPLVETHPHLFSQLPVFVSDDHVSQMRHVIQAVERVVTNPRYREAALTDAPAIAHTAPPESAVLMGFDFHVGNDGPKLIEINTNAGGAMLNAMLARAQRACCPEVDALMCGADRSGALDDVIFDSFVDAWQLARGTIPMRRIAIVDTTPSEQYLYPEFLLFQRLFEARGIDTVIVDPAELELDDGVLRHDGRAIDLVYNRLTDFYLESAATAALRRAYEQHAVVVTPHPHAHALYANKRNLALLTNARFLREIGVAEDTIDTLMASVPETCIVTEQNASRFWSERKQWFFKPARGFGSRGSYRGDKVTRSVFAEITNGGYVAQRLVPPSVRVQSEGDSPSTLKVDLRNYVYRGNVQLIAARLYQGQTTNFRTPGGGFAPVFHPRMAGDCGTLV